LIVSHRFAQRLWNTLQFAREPCTTLRELLSGP